MFSVSIKKEERKCVEWHHCRLYRFCFTNNVLVETGSNNNNDSLNNELRENTLLVINGIRIQLSCHVSLM